MSPRTRNRAGRHVGLTSWSQVGGALPPAGLHVQAALGAWGTRGRETSYQLLLGGWQLT